MYPRADRDCHARLCRGVSDAPVVVADTSAVPGSCDADDRRDPQADADAGERHARGYGHGDSADRDRRNTDAPASHTDAYSHPSVADSAPADGCRDYDEPAGSQQNRPGRGNLDAGGHTTCAISCDPALDVVGL